MFEHIAFTASPAEIAQDGLDALVQRYGQHRLEEADVVVALGGDGFMLQTLHATQDYQLPVYGMNRGTVGFLMNVYHEDDLMERLRDAERAEIHPLSMRVTTMNGEIQTALAINEVSLLRSGPQAAACGPERKSDTSLIASAVWISPFMVVTRIERGWISARSASRRRSIRSSS